MDTFCARCGGRQATAAARASAPRFLEDITPRTASMACYIPIVGWIAAIIVLATARFQDERAVRFHAFQGLYLFVVWLLVDWVLKPFVHMAPSPGAMRATAGLLQVAVFAGWIWMIIKTSQEQMFRLPIVGELAERSVAEQR